MTDEKHDADDEVLAGVDLGAWQSPSPPAGLADAVIARMRAPVSVVAVPELVEPVERAPRRWVGVAGVAAAAAVAGGLAVWGLGDARDEAPRAPRNRHGARIAARAEHLVLDRTTADLDPGSELRWTRDGRHLTAQQLRGTVRWAVAGDDILRIDPGASGLAGFPASIEASGASLRVEVSMNLSDTRILGATTAVATTVALATVTVYQGHIQATSGGQTIQIEPGATVALRPGQPPQPVLPHDDAPVVVGGTTDVQALQAELAAANRRVAELTAQRAERPAATATTYTEVSPPQLDAHRRSGDRNVSPDAATLQAMALAGHPVLEGRFRLCVDTDGAVSSVQRIKSTRFDKYDQAIEHAMRGWVYKPFLIDNKPTAICTTIVYLYRRDSEASGDAPKPCEQGNVNDAVTQAANQYNNGVAAAALEVMQHNVLSCKPDARMYWLAALYACAAQDAPAARQLFAKLGPLQRPVIELRCLQQGISLATVPGRGADATPPR